MVGFEGIKPILPNWRVNPQSEQQQKQRDRREEDETNAQQGQDQNTDDDCPHIDEFV